ncbi:MAG: 2-(1,2-epoxy-1,2-dihydrophenyl)acetyl-CoA isomerase [Chloroflexi bacterium]|nr:2-(1,2-epoxy-1,2-dihydrophenyl)acetyl-CoA isomerase [Chloroflexota bacterium]
MEFKTIKLHKEDGIATITLDRADVLNAVSEDMAMDLAAAIDDVGDDDQTRVLIITAAGRAFCAGGDFKFEKIKGKQVLTPEDLDIWPKTTREVRRGKIPPRAQRHIILGLQNLDKPTIAVINGVAAGFGFDLALACDIRLGSPKASFVIGYTSAGVAPDSGGTWLMPRVMGVGKTLEYIFTGDPCTAEEAYRIGLLNRLIPAEQLQEESIKMARKIAKGSPIAYRLSKLQVYKGLGMDLDTALAFAMACVTIATGSEDHKEALRSFADRRLPEFKDR